MAGKTLMAMPSEAVVAKEQCDYCIACMACGITPTPDIEFAIAAHLASLFAMA